MSNQISFSFNADNYYRALVIVMRGVNEQNKYVLNGRLFALPCGHGVRCGYSVIILNIDTFRFSIDHIYVLTHLL